MKRMNHYQTLGVPANATAEQIKVAYRHAIREAHPDQVVGRLARAEEAGNTREIDAAKRAMQKAEEQSKQINAAYAVLSDPTKRRWYDLTLHRAGARSTYRPPQPRPSPTQAPPRPKPPPPKPAPKRSGWAVTWTGFLIMFAGLRFLAGLVGAGSEGTQFESRYEINLATVEAMNDVQVAGTLAVSPAENNLQMGDTYYSLGMYEEAIQQYTMAIGSKFSTIDAYYKRGLAHHALMFDPQDVSGQQALADFKIAVSLDDTYTDAHLELGKLYAARWQYTKDESDRINALYHLNRYMALAGIGERSKVEGLFELLR
jgi:curved DNA-binding protein CbpA